MAFFECIIKKIFNTIFGEYKPYTAFTLAEVIIVLGIIGIIAAMTIPTVIQNIKTQQTISALKKNYSTFSQAYTLAIQDNGSPDSWDISTNTALINILSPYLKIIKNCGLGTGCFPPNTTYQYLRGGDYEDYDSASDGRAKLILADGSSIALNSYNNLCTSRKGSGASLQNTCGSIIVDINGFKGPNQFGIDLFNYYFTKYGVVPAGTKAENDGFAPHFPYPFDTSCRDKSTADGNGCTAWVIYNDNMDYLKCNTLSWDGLTKCN